jgi:hypothetical protein
MNESPNPEILMLEQALHHLELAAGALDDRDKAHRRRLGVYAVERLSRGELGLVRLRVENELRRLHQQCAEAEND